MTLNPEAALRLPAFFQAVGFAFWQHQELENTAKDYVVVRLRNARGVGRERGEAISEEAHRRTFGSVVEELIRSGVVTGDLAIQLRLANKDRNWLFHRARGETRGFASDEAKFRDIMARLNAMAERSLSLTKTLGRELELYVAGCGVSRNFIDREAERLARSWGFE